MTSRNPPVGPTRTLNNDDEPKKKDDDEVLAIFEEPNVITVSSLDQYHKQDDNFFSAHSIKSSAPILKNTGDTGTTYKRRKIKNCTSNLSTGV